MCFAFCAHCIFFSMFKNYVSMCMSVGVSVTGRGPGVWKTVLGPLEHGLELRSSARAAMCTINH